MKNSVLWKLSAAFAGLAGCLSLSVSAMAAVPAGTLEGADESSVYGWVWDSDNYNHIIPVEISIYPAGSSQTLKTDIIKADDYQDKLQESIGDGYHGFVYSVDWDQFEDAEFHVTAYAAEDERVFLGELTYNKETRTCVMKSGTQAESARTASNPPAPASEAQGAPSSPEDRQDTASPLGPDAGSSSSKPVAERISPAENDQRNPASSSKSAPESASPAENDQQNPASSSKSGTRSAAAPQKDEEYTASSAPKGSQSDKSSAGGEDKKAADDSQSSTKYLASWESGPGVPQPEPPKEEPEYVSLGIFTTTGYCSCEICCPSGSSLTYSGTVPQPNHTISADISVFPIGTRLMIDDVIYTVEDIGSNVTGNKLDIFYATHEEAENHGVMEVEVFSVSEEQDS